MQEDSEDTMTPAPPPPPAPDDFAPPGGDVTGSAGGASSQFQAAEDEIGQLVERVRQIGSTMLDDARHRADELTSRSQSEATRILDEARRDALELRERAIPVAVLRQLQAAIEGLAVVHAELARQLNSFPAGDQGAAAAPTSYGGADVNGS